MDNKQKANAYAIAKVLGYEKSIDEFIQEYSQYYEKTIKELNSRPFELGKAEAIENPLKNMRLKSF